DGKGAHHGAVVEDDLERGHAGGEAPRLHPAAGIGPLEPFPHGPPQHRRRLRPQRQPTAAHPLLGLPDGDGAGNLDPEVRLVDVSKYAHHVFHFSGLKTPTGSQARSKARSTSTPFSPSSSASASAFCRPTPW